MPNLSYFDKHSHLLPNYSFYYHYHLHSLDPDDPFSDPLFEPYVPFHNEYLYNTYPTLHGFLRLLYATLRVTELMLTIFTSIITMVHPFRKDKKVKMDPTYNNAGFLYTAVAILLLIPGVMYKPGSRLNSEEKKQIKKIWVIYYLQKNCLQNKKIFIPNFFWSNSTSREFLRILFIGIDF